MIGTRAGDGIGGRIRWAAAATVAAAALIAAPGAAGAPPATVGFSVSTAGIPDGVSTERFVLLARSSLAHWGLAYLGTTRAPAASGDGANAIGFGAPAIAGAGAETVRRPPPARARRRTARVELDVVVNGALPWQQGPAYPSAAEVDLETVLLHEVGHLAGRGHAHGCAPTPMVATLAMGDWWRSAGDWHRAGCQA